MLRNKDFLFVAVFSAALALANLLGPHKLVQIFYPNGEFALGWVLHALPSPFGGRAGGPSTAAAREARAGRPGPAPLPLVRGLPPRPVPAQRPEALVR